MSDDPRTQWLKEFLDLTPQASGELLRALARSAATIDSQASGDLVRARVTDRDTPAEDETVMRGGVIHDEGSADGTLRRGELIQDEEAEEGQATRGTASSSSGNTEPAKKKDKGKEKLRDSDDEGEGDSTASTSSSAQRARRNDLWEAEEESEDEEDEDSPATKGTTRILIYEKPNLVLDLQCQVWKAWGGVLLVPALSAQLFADLPEAYVAKFEDDAQTIQELHDAIGRLTAELVGDWSDLIDAAEEVALRVDAEEDFDQLRQIQNRLNQKIARRGQAWRRAATEAVTDLLDQRMSVLSSRKKYKVKVASKLALTFGGLGAAAVGLATAATPAAPITLVPALVGMVKGVCSVAMQLRDIAIDAASLESRIAAEFENWKAWEQSGQLKTLASALDGAKQVASSFTGGISDLIAPSVSALRRDAGLLTDKINGMEVSLRGLSKGLNQLVDKAAQTDGVDPARFERLFGQITALADTIHAMRDRNEQFIARFDELQRRLKTRGIGVMASLASLVAGMAVGQIHPPAELTAVIVRTTGTVYKELQWVVNDASSLNRESDRRRPDRGSSSG